MSVPVEIWAGCYAVVVGPTLGVMAVDHRSRSGEWPHPERLDWGTVATEAAAVVGRHAIGWGRGWATEDQPIRRLVELVLSLGLLIRAGIWSMAWAVGGDDARDVNHGLVAVPIQGARIDTRVGIAILQLSIVGIWSQWAGPLPLAWPPTVRTLAAGLLVAQAVPLLMDIPLTAQTLLSHAHDMARKEHD